MKWCIRTFEIYRHLFVLFSLLSNTSSTHSLVFLSLSLIDRANDYHWTSLKTLHSQQNASLTFTSFWMLLWHQTLITQSICKRNPVDVPPLKAFLFSQTTEKWWSICIRWCCWQKEDFILQRIISLIIWLFQDEYMRSSGLWKHLHTLFNLFWNI